MSATTWHPSAHPAYMTPEIPSSQQGYMFVRDFKRLEWLRQRAEQARRLQDCPRVELGKTLVLSMDKPAGWDALHDQEKMKFKRGETDTLNVSELTLTRFRFPRPRVWAWQRMVRGRSKTKTWRSHLRFPIQLLCLIRSGGRSQLPAAIW